MALLCIVVTAARCPQAVFGLLQIPCEHVSIAAALTCCTFKQLGKSHNGIPEVDEGSQRWDLYSLFRLVSGNQAECLLNVGVYVMMEEHCMAAFTLIGQQESASRLGFPLLLGQVHLFFPPCFAFANHPWIINDHDQWWAVI